jgi:BMFP domain-containing protein YqiC
MFDNTELEGLAKKLYSTLPQGLKNIESDLQGKFRDILQSTFARFDLVTREEFDVHVKVLAKTRAKLEELEKELQTLSHK